MQKFFFAEYAICICLFFASCVVGKDIAIGAASLFDSQVGQIGHRVANGSSALRRFFGAVLPKR